MTTQPKKKTVFRRIRGRIVPISVSNEASAISSTVRDVSSKPSALAAVGRALAYTAGGFALAFGAGRLKKASLLASSTGLGSALERAAKFSDYGGKAAASTFVGHEIASLDRATTKDEKSKLLNLGAQGTGALAIGAGLVGGYGAYRFSKRFTKWGQYGGRFPWKLKDI